jgi:casein kinase I family protein HRR25
LLYFVRGSLPWQGSKIKDDDERDQYIKRKKVDTSVEELCHGLPEEFANYLNYTRRLTFDELPNYSYLSKMLRRLYLRRGFEYDNVYDWTIRKFAIMQDKHIETSISKARNAAKSGLSFVKVETQKKVARRARHRRLRKRERR